MNLLRTIELIGSTGNQTGTKTTIFGPAIDMSDADGCLIFAIKGSSGWGSVGSSMQLHIQACSSTSGTFVNFGSTIMLESTGTTGTHKGMVIDYYRPLLQDKSTTIARRYIRGALMRSTDDCAWLGLKYGLRNPGGTHLSPGGDGRFPSIVAVGTTR